MKLLREPLFQFLILGAALFGVFALIGNSATTTITISSSKVEELIKGFRYDNKRSPTSQEVDRIIDDYVREEILSREALERGLALEIPTVRRELRQKIEFQTDSAETPVPTDEQLQAYLNSHEQAFRKPDGTLPPLAEVRQSVETSWAGSVQKESRDRAYQKMRGRYNVVVHRPPASLPAEAK